MDCEADADAIDVLLMTDVLVSMFAVTESVCKICCVICQNGFELVVSAVC